MDCELNRIIILEKNIKGDLSKCNICNVNFTAIQPCIVCQTIIEKEEKLGRKLSEEEFNEVIREFE
ncbi:MAG: hypothetical protein AABW80_01345 [Nanoarchaeota archaeon]